LLTRDVLGSTVNRHTENNIPFPKGGNYETVIISSSNGLRDPGRDGRFQPRGNAVSALQATAKATNGAVTEPPATVNAGPSIIGLRFTILTTEQLPSRRRPLMPGPSIIGLRFTILTTEQLPSRRRPSMPGPSIIGLRFTILTTEQLPSRRRLSMPESRPNARCTILHSPVSLGVTPSWLVIPDSTWPVYPKSRTPVACNTPPGAQLGAQPCTTQRMNLYPLTRHRTSSQTTRAGYERGTDSAEWSRTRITATFGSRVPPSKAAPR